ncbi:MAG: zinc ribbon domain-containing protein [Betaproteobacteria bacterium]|nr:zinc ribbon domain-containing protein [Betaproteobacteria bacterium]
MPIYEYACNDCHRDFEKLVRAAQPAPVCPYCGSGRLTRKLSTFAAVTGSSAAAAAPAPCGTCGHPAGPGACAIPAR